MKKLLLSFCLVAFAAAVSAAITNINVPSEGSCENHSDCTYRGSCNISSHKCPGYVAIGGGNHNCANCANHGYSCHAVNHSPR